MEAVLERAAAPVKARSITQKPTAKVAAKPATPAPAQINVRLDRELKEAGDRELEHMGITPSQAVRALWEILAAGGKDADAVRDVLFGQEREAEPEMSVAQKRKLEVMEEIKQSWQNLADTLGLDLSTHVPMTDEELKEARYDYLREKWGEL